MHIGFGTKAETLERMAAAGLNNVRVPPQLRFTVRQWRDDAASILDELTRHDWSRQALIVRSSAQGEDAATGSQAGRFRSETGLGSAAAVREAVERVIESYGKDRSTRDDDQVFIQPYLTGVTLSGVAFTRDPNTGSPYIVVNYDETGDTAAVTGGGGDTRTFVCWKYGEAVCPNRLGVVVVLARQLEAVLGHDCLDIEFAFTGEEPGQLWLLQVRPLPAMPATVNAEQHRDILAAIAGKITAVNRPHPHLHGRRTVYGVMPDWNPAEIIGLRPRPLSLSLYRDLVTDSIWAYQRDNYGYKNLRSFPLLLHFHGLPYIDTRASFNSFVPNDIEAAFADRLVDYYIDRLLAIPALHDKVEFEIIFSCYTPDLPQRLSILGDYGFSVGDRQALADSLRRLTNRIINRETGLWRKDAAKIDILEQRRQRVLAADMDMVSRIYWLLEDCKRYGTLPFAGLARVGFIATQLLKSLVALGILSPQDRDAFMAGLNTVSTGMGRDFLQLDRATFLAKYGHLRPGTYDILSLRYDEAPDLYFNWRQRQTSPLGKHQPFALRLDQMRTIDRLLREHALEYDVVGLFDFLQASIEGREYSKFVFTRSLSDALSLLAALGSEHGFSREDMSFIDIACIRELYASSDGVHKVLAQAIAQGRSRYAQTRQILLPPLIASAEDVWAFHRPPTEPNFITQKRVTGPVRHYSDAANLANAIVAIPSADPGFDWLFSRGIAGFITAYGGANSHMAVRAGELGLPAVLGAGETLFGKWSAARTLTIDCANCRVEVLAGDMG
ncbi:MAG: phosphoenolpyruvate synthase [Rhodospirillales bacterium]|nr:phosphoenolpyruvate synthase [Rhodospirillales bacterium]